MTPSVQTSWRIGSGGMGDRVAVAQGEGEGVFGDPVVRGALEEGGGHGRGIFAGLWGGRYEAGRAKLWPRLCYGFDVGSSAQEDGVPPGFKRLKTSVATMFCSPAPWRN